MIHFLLVLFVIDRVHNTNFSSRPSLEKQLKYLYNLRIEIVVPALAGYLASGSFTPVMSATTKQFHFWSIKVIPLFRFSVIPYSTFYSILCVCVYNVHYMTCIHMYIIMCTDAVCALVMFYVTCKSDAYVYVGVKISLSPGCVRGEGGEVVWHPELPRNWIIFTFCH